ncbi:Superfamily II RNA helicase [Richelia intracellularis HH01]|uniref:Superfamily II RNA helicase n=1 Tax=Richelia intracellularis HH01 TaxID=1165094 RepID=M1X3C1_9NOST|nr:RNA helicase [Richelia intracellularis]CCH68315.1 Superfamily II RNA helicase [Richelia intracellularis HH01]HAE05305.1 RNA helicase [Richelia sp.]
MNYSALSPELDPSSIFPFELDEFQLKAIASLNSGRSVVVCAPTGSGKTLVGEYAIYRALIRGKRVFYTTPLKALSNQKLRDFREKFGLKSVGLLTGDVSINRDAPILVMTTEIFRNMLYGTPIGRVGTSLVDVEAVVLDECHYMNDRHRGTVWEESIIYCPRTIQLVALSATVTNSRELTNWLIQVHGYTDLIHSSFRPVPLEFYFGNTKGVFLLLNNSLSKINPRLIQKRKKKQNGEKKIRSGRPEAPSSTYILNQLKNRDMLPAIYFIFSRRGCDKAVKEVSNLSLVNEEETSQLRYQIDEFLKRNPDAGRSGQIMPLYRGIAAHHAGILPAWKGLVEELFQQGLIKVVFATETLAAGINMPARTTVISTLSKRTDAGHQLLNASDFLQMAGRAGRRGMDEKGYVVTLQTPFEGSKEAAYLATSKPDPLVSQFTPSYGMVLNLLQTHTIKEAKELVERSFGQYLANLHLQPQYKHITNLQEQLKNLQEQVAAVDELEVARYEKLRQKLKAEQKLLKTLYKETHNVRNDEISMMLGFAVSGTLLSLKGKHITVSVPVTAILISRTHGSGQSPYLVCLGRDNRWYVTTTTDVVGLHAEIPRIEIPEDLLPPAEMPLKPGQCRRGNQQTAIIARKIPAVDSSFYNPPEIIEQLQRVNDTQDQLQIHHLFKTGSVATFFRRKARAEELQSEIKTLQEQVAVRSQQHWGEFLNLISILQQFGCLQELIPTKLGQIVAAIRGENELWLGLVLASGEIDNLNPHNLAAIIAALVTESPRPDSFVKFELSQESSAIWSKLQKIRRAVLKTQYKHKVALTVGLENRYINMISLLEKWALGIDWTEICENTSLDEGDVVRILRRTLDLLSQIPHVPYLSESLRRNAYRAIQLIDRFPINEVVG